MRLGWWALAWAVLPGCAGCNAKAVHDSAPPPAGIHIPLPEGWSAVAIEGQLKAGPKGRAVLRVEAHPNAAADPLPAPLSLAEQFSREGASLRVTPVSEVAEKDLSMVTLEISKQGSRARAMLGVKRVGTRLLLCSSEPGSSEEEVRLAADACRGLSGGGDT